MSSERTASQIVSRGPVRSGAISVGASGGDGLCAFPAAGVHDPCRGSPGREFYSCPLVYWHDRLLLIRVIYRASPRAGPVNAVTRSGQAE